MKNTIYVDITTEKHVNLVSQIDDKTNTLFVNLKSNMSKNPIIDVGGDEVTPTDSDFTYEVPTTKWQGTGTLIITISDDDGNIAINIVMYSGDINNLMIIQDSETNYHFANIVPNSGGGGYEDCATKEDLEEATQIILDAIGGVGKIPDTIRSFYVGVMGYKN